jgi:hypothetical protein
LAHETPVLLNNFTMLPKKITMKKIIFLFFIITCLVASSQVPSYVPTNGLVGFWPFTGNANDISGHSNHGTANGAVLTSDRFSNSNSAYSFNGTSDYILVPDDPSLSGFNDMSISVWVNLSAFNWVQDIVAKWDQQLDCGNYSDTYVAAFLNDQTHWNTNNNNVALFANPPLFTNDDLNQWKHLVFTSSSTAGEAIYVNGVLMATNSTIGGICNSTNPVYFGAGFDGNWNMIHRFLNGKLDDIGIWNRVLTLCEINQLYTASVFTIGVSSSRNVICLGNSATLTATGAANYLWNTSAASAAIVVSPLTTTVYTVTGTNTITGCSHTRTITQTVSECIGIGNTTHEKGFINLYPNPTDRFLILDLHSMKEGDVSIEVKDIFGKTVLLETFTLGKSESQLQVNTEQLQNGVYFINIIDPETQFVYTEKIIITR